MKNCTKSLTWNNNRSDDQSDKNNKRGMRETDNRCKNTWGRDIEVAPLNI